MTSIGDLDTRVTFQRSTSVDDGAGGSTEGNLVPVGKRWASVEPLSIVQRERYATLEVEATDRLIIRAPFDVRSRDIVSFKGRTLTVETVRDPDNEGRWLELICQEIQ